MLQWAQDVSENSTLKYLLDLADRQTKSCALAEKLYDCMCNDETVKCMEKGEILSVAES